MKALTFFLAVLFVAMILSAEAFCQEDQDEQLNALLRQPLTLFSDVVQKHLQITKEQEKQLQPALRPLAESAGEAQNNHPQAPRRSQCCRQ